MNLVNDALCTIDDIQNHSELKDVSLHNDVVTDLINIYTKFICNYCGVTSFKSAVYTDYYDGKGDSFLYVKNYPITNVSLLADDIDFVWGSDSTYSSIDYRIIDNGYGIYLKDDLFSVGIQNIKIVYTAGYTSIPDDLKYVCIKEVIRAFKHRQDWEVLTESIGERSSTYIPPELSDDSKNRLSFYRNNWF